MSSHQLISDPKWVGRMEKYFEFIDRENYGIITIANIQGMASRLEVECKPSATKMVKLRATLYKFWRSVGLTNDVLMKKSPFLVNINRLGMEEVISI